MKNNKIQPLHISLLLNFIYAIAHCFVGFASYSWWFVTLGAYYTILTVMRFSVLRVKSKAKGDFELELFSEKITGVFFIILSFCLIGIITLSAIKDRGNKYHLIIMLAIATYTFTKITLAIIGIVKSRKSSSPINITLRNISLADAVVSIYSLQRSMLVSFPGMAEYEIKIFNIATGTVVWIIVLFLGINLIRGNKIMAKSKFVKANEKIAEKVVTGYKKIETGVVDGYKKIEKGVVDGYTKIEDKFVDTYLTKDGETIEEAKERLKKEPK